MRFDHRLKRNVLEIVLEKNNHEAEIDHHSVANLLRSIGIDITSQVEGTQIKNRMISVWIVPGVNIERFCREESIRVAPGISTSFIRPAGRKDVTVSITGLDFNTPDTFIIEYLNNFGTVLDNKVIYSTYSEGPFKGKYTGERKYQVDFTNSRRSMGSFHIIDGSRVKVFYRGNIKTCARCHQTANNCPGDAIARECEQNQGPKISLLEHMKNLWGEIAFVPSSFSLNTLETEDELFDAPLKSGAFGQKIDIPKPSENDKNKYRGITIRNFNPKVSNQDILNFLNKYGLPSDTPQDSLSFLRSEKNTCVTIEPLSPDIVMNLTAKLHFPSSEEKFFDLPLYTRPIRNVTPVKDPNKPTGTISKSVDMNPGAASTGMTKSPTTGSASKTSSPPPSASSGSARYDHIKHIPGLDRDEQLKPLKKSKDRKKKSKKAEDKDTVAENHYQKESFLLQGDSQLEGFRFSDCSDDDSNAEGPEDFKDALNEPENFSHLTPSRLPFSQKLVAAEETHGDVPREDLTHKKRSANSPIDETNSKKTKAVLTKQKL